MMVSDAYRFAVPILILGIVLSMLHAGYAAVPLFVLAAFIFYFFRNPDRPIPSGGNLIVSPADGKVVEVSRGDGGEQTIGIFMSIFNVHVNRSPISGRLEKLEYKRGRFQAAFDKEASRVNEQNVLTIAGPGIRIVVRQIAGLIARRVVCWKKPGDAIDRGERIGLIRFGSRVDVVLPEHVKILVRVGDRVQGGSSVLGDCA